MKQFVICSLLVLILTVYVVVGARPGNAARAPVRSRRNTIVDGKFEYGKPGLIDRSFKKRHLLHPHTRSRREAENADFYKRGHRAADPEERLKRVKKFDPDTIV